jgi:hypothetical protein
MPHRWTFVESTFAYSSWTRLTPDIILTLCLRANAGENSIALHSKIWERSSPGDQSRFPRCCRNFILIGAWCVEYSQWSCCVQGWCFPLSCCAFEVYLAGLSSLNLLSAVCDPDRFHFSGWFVYLGFGTSAYSFFNLFVLESVFLPCDWPKAFVLLLRCLQQLQSLDCLLFSCKISFLVCWLQLWHWNSGDLSL